MIVGLEESAAAKPVAAIRERLGSEVVAQGLDSLYRELQQLSEARLTAWTAREATIQQRVRNAVAQRCLVNFYAFGEDSNGLPLDNLDAIAVRGKCRFRQQTRALWRGGGDYDSGVVANPTWLTVALLANEMIHTTGNDLAYFLEGLREVDIDDDGVRVCEFLMGN